METLTFQANASHVGATEQLVNGKSVVDQTNESISTEQENYAQNFHQNNKNMEELTTTPLEQGMVNAPTPPTAEGGICQQSSAEDPAQPKTSKSKKEKGHKDIKPSYTDDQRKKLETVTKVCEAEIKRVLNDSRYNAVSYNGGENALIDLRAAHKSGVDFYTPIVNRTHGNDMKKTGESLLAYGSQHPLLVITTKMAEEAGLSFVSFGESKALSSSGLVVIDGNGRIKYLLGMDVDSWPPVFAVFPTKEANGFYNLLKGFETINTQVSVWKTQDMVQKRLLEEGDNAHEGWRMVNDLVKKGYNYQAACQLATLNTDRINKRQVNGGKAKDIFTHHKSAKRIYDALVKKFEEGEDKTLKTKAFTQEVSNLWGKLQKKSGDDSATASFVEFINGLPDTKVNDIKNAKNDKTMGTTKDAVRQKILDEEFIKFVGSKGLTID